MSPPLERRCRSAARPRAPQRNSTGRSGSARDAFRRPIEAISSSSPPSIREWRTERVEPALDLDEPGHPPLGAIVQESHCGPEEAVGAARDLRGVKEQIQLSDRRQTPARPRHSLSIALYDPRPFLGG